MQKLLYRFVILLVRDYLVSLVRYPDFRYIWLTGIFSFGGMWIFTVTATWIAVEASGSSRWAGIIAFSSLLPFLLFSALGGFFADRYNRRNVVIAASFGNTVLSIIIAVGAVTESLDLWHLAIGAFLAGGLRAVMEPAIQALIPNQVDEKHMLNAITLNALTHHGSRFFGLLIAAPLLAGGVAISISGFTIIPGGVKTVLILSAIFTALSAVFSMLCTTVSYGRITSNIETSYITREAKRSFLGINKRATEILGGIGYVGSGMLEGFKYIYTHKIISIFILLVAFHCALVMSFESIMPIFSQESLRATDGSILGYLVMAFGAGSIIGVLLVAGLTKEKHKGWVLLWSGIGSGITPILMALMQEPGLAMLFAAFMGATQASFMAITNVYVLTVCPDRLRGRVSSLYVLHAGGIMAFANLGYGFMADLFNARVIFIITGLIFMVFLMAISTSLPKLRNIYRTGETTA